MEPRIAFLVGIVVTQLINQRPNQIDPAEITLLKHEIALTRSTLEEYHAVQAQCKWNEWVLGLAVKANIVFDILVVGYFLSKAFVRRPAALPVTRPDTGGSSDSEGPDQVPGCEKTNLRSGSRDRQLVVAKTRPTRPSDLK